jgi:hypothetical protein
MPWFHQAITAALVLILPLEGAQSRGPLERPSAEKKESDKAPAAGAMEVLFIDDSALKLTLREERIELITPYGKLLIPVSDIERIEVAFRLPDEMAKRIEDAVADLGKADFTRREEASAELRRLGVRAYPALLKAEKSSDAEVARRTRELLEKIRGEVPEERLEIRSHDVISTADSKFTGRISAMSLKVNTFQFGEQQLKLSDVREIRSPSAADPQAMNALPDPGNLSAYMGQMGKVHVFRVTGQVQAGAAVARPGLAGLVIAGQGFVWGTDVYTLDSALALAAVHAGVLKVGQTGAVRVKILGPQAAFPGSTRHGVTSQAYGFYNGAYQFLHGRARSVK